MSAAEFIDTDEEMQKMVMRWTTAGHEFIPERTTFRHRMFKKDLDPCTVIRYEDGTPIILYGKQVTVGDVLPERADLALDSSGKLLNANDFEKRYEEYLRWFRMVEGSDPKSEPIPDIVDFVTAIPDPFSDSPGMVQVHYDARKPAEVERTHLYDPNTDQLVEINKSLETQGKAIEHLLEKSMRRGPGRPRKDEE